MPVGWKQKGCIQWSIFNLFLEDDQENEPIVPTPDPQSALLLINDFSNSTTRSPVQVGQSTEKIDWALKNLVSLITTVVQRLDHIEVCIRHSAASSSDSSSSLKRKSKNSKVSIPLIIHVSVVLTCVCVNVYNFSVIKVIPYLLLWLKYNLYIILS